MSLRDISNKTNLNKATLHEHLSKLNEAGLVKKNEREGHKWVYYKLTWKGECLLHPENTRIVVLFTATFITLFVGIVQLVSYVKGVVVGKVVTFAGTTSFYRATETRGLTGGYTFDNFAQITLNGTNQTTSEITQIAVENFNIKGQLGNVPAPSDIDLDPIVVCAGDTAKSIGNDVASEGVNGVTFNEASSKIMTWYDPSLQWIAIICLVIFGVLLSIGVWRLWKNKKQKL